MNWDTATDIILYASIALVAVYGILGLYEWITRKSLKKVDRELKMMLIPLALMVIIYIIFDKFLVLNTAPNNPDKPSFPSSHVLVTTTIFLLTALALPRYIKTKSLRIALDAVMLILIAATSAGRVISENHWASDVIAALIFAIILSVIYYILIHERKNDVHHLHENN